MVGLVEGTGRCVSVEFVLAGGHSFGDLCETQSDLGGCRHAVRVLRHDFANTEDLVEQHGEADRKPPAGGPVASEWTGMVVAARDVRHDEQCMTSVSEFGQVHAV